MLIKLNIKRQGGSKIDIGDKLYHFAPDKNGDHVCDVTDKEHIKRFMSIDAYEPHDAVAEKAVKTGVIPSPPEQDVPASDESMADNDTYDAMDRGALAAEIESRTGKAPHHKTGEISLRAALRELDTSEAA
jgi:hypothetical protein